MTKVYKIAVYGSAVKADENTEKLASELGKEIAQSGCILVTGGCPGLPHAAAKAAASLGGRTLAFSPSWTLEEHKKDFPVDGYTEWVFVPDDIRYDIYSRFKYRNVISCAETDAGIIICGRIGTLNEFTNLYDMKKVIGVLKGSAGITELIPEVIRIANKDNGAVVIYESDPAALVKKVIEELKRR